MKGFTFAQGQQNLCKIDKPYENPAKHSSPATGDFLESRWDNTKYPRVEGKRAYRAVLGRAAETETGDRGGQYDQRTGVQPEGVRVNDEPEPETGGAGSESQPAGSVAGNIRKFCEEFRLPDFGGAGKNAGASAGRDVSGVGSGQASAIDPTDP